MLYITHQGLAFVDRIYDVKIDTKSDLKITFEPTYTTLAPSIKMLKGISASLS
jgi:hypothetical protein